MYAWTSQLHPRNSCFNLGTCNSVCVCVSSSRVHFLVIVCAVITKLLIVIETLQPIWAQLMAHLLVKDTQSEMGGFMWLHAFPQFPSHFKSPWLILLFDVFCCHCLGHTLDACFPTKLPGEVICLSGAMLTRIPNPFEDFALKALHFWTGLLVNFGPPY